MSDVLALPARTDVHRASVVLPVLDADGAPAPGVLDGAVAVRAGRILAVGPLDDVVAAARDRGDDVAVHEWDGVLIPGLVNAHTHLQYCDYRAMAATGLPFPAWIAEMMRRREHTTDEEWASAATWGAAELLRTGTTAVADVVTDSPAVAPVRTSGLQGISYLEMVGWTSVAWESGGREALGRRLSDARGFGHEIGLMPHAPYTVDLDVVHDIVTTARAAGLRVHTHLAESDAETEYVATGTGRFADGARAAGWDLALVRDGGCGLTPVGMLDDAGCLGDDVHVAHGVHVGPHDRERLRRLGVVVALCPRSNAILRSGTPPVADYLREGSTVALGTDSLASSPSLDLLEEARAAAAVAREQGYAEQDLAARLLQAATAGGAAALGRSDIGRLVAGARADFAVVDVSGGGEGRTAPAALEGLEDPASAVLDRGRVGATVLGGVVLPR